VASGLFTLSPRLSVPRRALCLQSGFRSSGLPGHR